jgi:putative MATE family efflux protein
MGAGVLRAVGDSKRPFYYLIVSCGINIVLDLIFVALLDMKAAGAALATVLSQLVSAVLVARSLVCSRSAYRLTIKNFRIDWAKTGYMLKVGVPIGIQSSLYSVANIMVQSAINGFGTDAVAAWGVCGKLDFIIWLLMDAMGIAMSTFTAQNYGAGQTDRLRQGVLACTLISLATVIPVSALLFLLAEPLGRLFLDDSGVIGISTHLMRTFMAPLYFTYIGGEVLSGVIRGTGEAFKPMLITLICTCAVRVVWVLTAVPAHHTLDTVIASYPITWIISSTVFVIYYKSGGWLKKKITM